MEVVRRPAGAGVLMKRFVVSRASTADAAPNEVAESLEPALQSLSSGPADGSDGYSIEWKSAASAPTRDWISTSRVSPCRQSVERARPATSACVRGEPVPAAFTQDGDRGLLELGLDDGNRLHQTRSITATSMLHKRAWPKGIDDAKHQQDESAFGAPQAGRVRGRVSGRRPSTFPVVAHSPFSALPVSSSAGLEICGGELSSRAGDESGCARREAGPPPAEM